MEDERKSPSSLFADIESEKKKKKLSSSGSGSSNHEVAAAASSYVADDILRFEILPRLSFKTLSRFMIVSKSWRALISNDPLFALDQSRHPSPISSAFVYLSLRGLEFLQLPNTPVGVPDPSLSVLQYSDRVGLVASTNGLLCLYAHGNILYLVNPATEKRPERIPCRRSWKRHCCVGLAFDPSVSATHYTLVYPHREHTNLDADEVEYWFEVFTSGGDRNWVASSQRVTVRGFHWCHETAVFAGGVLYWDCTEYLIWFDPCKDLAGWMLMPTTMTPAAGARHALGASELGRLLTCTVMVEEAVEVFVMTKKNAGEWTRRHRVSLQAMIERGGERKSAVLRRWNGRAGADQQWRELSTVGKPHLSLP